MSEQRKREAKAADLTVGYATNMSSHEKYQEVVRVYRYHVTNH
jgi:hypothetical protein